MGYRHAAVRHLTNPDSEANINRAKQIQQAREAKWGYWLDEMPVTKELYAYGSALQEAFPFLKFWSSTRTQQSYMVSMGENEHIHVFKETYVCMDSSPYAVAQIGYGGYREKSDSDALYMTYARGIANEKYGTGRKQYYMKMSAQLKSAIKNALGNLVPYTAKEMAVIEYDKMRDLSNKSGETKASKLPALLGAVTHSVLLNEVRALHAAGAKFTTPEFQSIVDNVDEAVQLANTERSKRVDMVLVSFVERNGNMMADCSEVRDVRANHWPKVADEVNTYLLADVPQFIVEKVSVLQTLDNGNHVDGVGMKIDEKMFWVEK